MLRRHIDQSSLAKDLAKAFGREALLMGDDFHRLAVLVHKVGLGELLMALGVLAVLLVTMSVCVFLSESVSVSVSMSMSVTMTMTMIMSISVVVRVGMSFVSVAVRGGAFEIEVDEPAVLLEELVGDGTGDTLDILDVMHDKVREDHVESTLGSGEVLGGLGFW